MKSAEDFFSNLDSILQKSGIENSLFVLYGEEPYFSKKLKNSLKSRGFDISHYEVKKSGPDSDLLDACAGTSLFMSQSAVWVTKFTSPQSWKKESQKIWEQLLGLVKGGGLKVFLQSASEKKYANALLDKTPSVKFDLDPVQKNYWLKQINSEKKNSLNAEQLSFLSQREDDLLTFENSIELWSLGGDLWAEKTLGWSAQDRAQKSFGPTDTLAYKWVDATLNAKTNEAMKILTLIESQEPLMLLGLLAKSVKILAQLEAGIESFKSEPPFLVNKLKKVKTSWPSMGLSNRGKKLLQKCARVDFQMKTTRVDPWLLLGRLSER